MLARSRRVPGLGSLDVDHAATFMRLTITGDRPDLVTDAVVGILRLEGYDATPLTSAEEATADARIRTWLGTDAAVELSREEARAVAAEIVSRFTRGREIAPALSDRLRRMVAERLYRSLTADGAATHLGSLVDRALPDIAGASRAYLSPHDASAFASFLKTWRPRP